MSIQSKITKPFISILLPLVALSCIFFYACQEPEPEDPRYDLNAPTLLLAEPVSDTEIQLMWKNSEQHAEEIAILRKSIGLVWQTIAIVPIAQTVYIDSNLDLGTLYTYSLQSKVEINYSELSNELQASPSFLAPTNLLATALTDTTVHLSWVDVNSFEKGFIIQRNEEDILVLQADSTEFIDSGLIFGQLYNYRVAAFTDSNQTGWSIIDSVTTIFPGPSNFIITPQNDDGMLIAWTDNSDFESGFILERDDGGGFTQIALLEPDITQYIDTGLGAGQVYEYRVAAVTNINRSEWLNSGSVSTLDLLTPINFTAVANQDSRISLSWTDLNLIELGFIVERDDGQGNGFIPLTQLPHTETSMIDTALTYGINYEYRVAAYTSQNTSDWVKSGKVSTEFPSPSLLVVSSVNDGAMQLEWRDNCSFESGYRIERDQGLGYVHLVDLLPNSQGYFDEGLTMDVSYSYRVAAYTESNTSDWLVSDNEQTSFPPPSTLNTYPINDSKISLEWVDNSTFELGFFIERNAGSGYIRVDTSDANQTTFLDTGLSFGSTYRYRVAAFTNSNVSQYAIGLSTNTIFPEPSGLLGFPLSESKIRLQWEDNCNFELGFILQRNDGTGFIHIDSLSENITEYLDENLVEGKYYSYRIAAYTGDNRSAWVNSGVVQTEVFPQPTSLTATPIDDSNIELTWVDNNDQEIGFIIERDMGDGNGYSEIAQVGSGVSQYFDAELLFGPTYSYRIASFSESRQSLWTLSIATQTFFPAPSNLIAEAVNDTTVILSWLDNCDFERNYLIEVDGGSGFVRTDSLNANRTATSIRTLSYGTSYTFRVSAQTNLNTSNFSFSDAIVTLLPDAPSGVDIEALSDAEIWISWVDNCNFETGYRIERNTDAAGFTFLADISPGAEQYIDSSLVYGTDYSYRIASFTPNNQSSWGQSGVASTIAPEEPNGLVGIPLSDTEIQVTWVDNSSFEDGFYIQRDAGAGWIDVPDANANQTTYRDSGLAYGVTYDYRISAYTTQNQSSWVSSDPLETVYPDLPTDLFVTAVSDHELRISWDDNCDFEAGYIIEKDDGNGFIQLISIGPDTSEFIDTGLQYGEFYYRYRVATFTNANTTNWVTSSYVNTVFPSPSFLSTSSTSDTEFLLTWVDNSSFETGFRIERDDGAGFNLITTTVADVTRYTDSNLDHNETYIYRVAAVSEYNTSDWVTSASSSTAFLAPTFLNALVISDASITLNWDDNYSFETGYRLQRSDDGAAYATIIEPGAGVTEYTNTGLTYGTDYRYRVAAYTAANTSDWVSSSVVTTILNQPTQLSATALSDASLRLTWTDNCSFEGGYKLERDDGAGFVVIAANLAANTESYTDTDLTYGDEYHYRLIIYTTGNTGDPVYLNSVGTVFPSPTFLTALATDDITITLSWDDNYSFETGYTLQRSDDGAAYDPLISLAAGVTEYTNTGLTYGIDYQYRVAAETATNTSDWISSSTLTTVFVGPSDIAVEAQDDVSIDISWTDNSSSETGFTLQRSVNGGSFTDINSPAANVTSYTNDALSLGVSYRYRVAAETATNTSAWSTSGSVSTLALDLPTSVTAVAITDASITISWNDNCDFETGYRLQRSDDGGAYATIISPAADATEYTDTGLTYGIDYQYRVAAYTTANTSAYVTSSVVSTFLNQPTQLSAVALSDANLRLTWTDNCSFEGGYKLERDDGAGFVEIVDLDANTTSYTNTGLTYGDEYHYRLIIYTTDNTGDPVYLNSVGTVFPSPTFLTASAINDASISLGWDDNYSFESGFTLERSDDGGAYAFINSPLAGVTEYTDTGLNYGTDYQYRVAAETATNTSDWVSSSTLATVFPAPSGFSAIPISNDEVLLSWTDNSSFETGFKLERDDGQGFNEIYLADDDITSYTNTGLSSGTLYTYRVRAYTADNNSPYSLESSSGYVVVPAGPYTYGEGDVITEDLNQDFLMMHYEVTNAQYVAYLNAAYIDGDFTLVNTSTVEGHYVGDAEFSAGNYEYIDLADVVSGHIYYEALPDSFYVNSGYANHPVTEVTWFGAYAFADYYDVLRLPTEFEWEKAARSDWGYDYPWGDGAPSCDQANISGCVGATQPVGLATGASPFGLLDMTGNVWEWTASYDGSTSNRVLRGGSFASAPTGSYVWYRYSIDSELTNASVGFRCVIDNP